MNGHQGHFLSRLDRLTPAHVELALRLYNDTDLVRYVLDRVALDPVAERVALSLHHPEEGPFVIVERDGRFVTCLAAGMRCRATHVVPREQLDDLVERGMTAKRRLETARRVAGPRLEAGALVGRVFRRADVLAREEVAAAAAFSPVLGVLYLRQALDAYLRASEIRNKLRGTLDRRATAQLGWVLRGLWQNVHGSSHLLVLAGAGAAEHESRLAEAGVFETLPLSLPLVDAGLSGPALRAIWATASFGSLFLPGCEARLAAAAGRASVLDAALALTAIALRHPRLRPRVRRALEAALEMVPGDDDQSTIEFAREVARQGLRVLDEPLCVETPRRLGAAVVVSCRSSLAHDCPHRYDRPEAVPEALALAAAIDACGDLWSQPPSLAFDLLPFLARAEAEDLYLPAELALVRGSDWSPRQALALVPPAPKPSRAAAVPTGPRRQGACPCGSGKKYKRCCETAPQRTAA